MKFKFLIITFLFLIVSKAYAVATVQSIESMGCHLNDSTCYVYVKEVVGPAACRSTSIRWSKDSVNGKEALSMFMVAFTSNKKVNFNITNTCYSTSPTFNYFIVYK